MYGLLQKEIENALLTSQAQLAGHTQKYQYPLHILTPTSSSRSQNLATLACSMPIPLASMVHKS